MRAKIVRYLACPACGSDLALSAEEQNCGEIVSGSLSCAGCGREYPIVRGVPRMNRSMEGLVQVARTFSYEWKSHHAGQLETDTLFGLTLDEDWQYFLDATRLTEQDLAGAIVLDAGCGSGRPTRQIAEHGAEAVIGVDINEAVDEAYAFCHDLDNVHIVQANILALPFKKRAFDLVWSNGVIHHTADAEAAHRALAAHVKPGGVLYVWVYAKRFNPFRFVKTVLDALRVTRMPEGYLLRLSKVFSYLSLGLLWVYRGARELPGLRPRTEWGRRTVRPRTVRELELTWFDALSPQYDSRHSEQEVVAWFERLGFQEIAAIEEPKVGVRGVAARR
jgi:SAM-dependent methyltransferase/uncharacterized protein YbaR (Trm112 family)